jgi:anti-sigma factor RsiW
VRLLPPACPQEETLAAFVDGQLDGEALSHLILHLATCPLCREVVSRIIRSRRDVLDNPPSPSDES